MNELSTHVCVLVYSHSCCWAVCEECGRKSTDEQLSNGSVVFA